MAERRHSFTQPSCANCWDERNPDRPFGDRPHQGEAEMCCHCGRGTRSGLYIRVDPTTVPFPTLTKE